MIHFKLEEGRRFSEDTYASKDDVKATYNQENVDPVWENVLSYRSFFDVETDLSNPEKSHYKVCLTKRLLGESYGFEKKLSHSLFLLLSLPSDKQNDFLRSKEFASLKLTAKINSVPIAPETIRKLENGELENYNSKFYILKAYLEAFRYASSRKEINLVALENINKLVSGAALTDKAIYRQEDKKEVLNPLTLVPKEDIPTHLEELFSFLKQEEVPSIFRALAILYFFKTVEPFEYYNEETSALFAKAFLKADGFEMMGFTLDFESIVYSKGEYTNRKLLESEKSLDLTYDLAYFLDYLKMDLANSEKMLLENHSEEEDKSEDKQVELQANDIPVVEARVEYALPTFPKTEKSPTTIDETARKLREVYPQLKKKQAHFYAGHCQIGLNYTIEQFKECENTVYETARTSMEDLANRGFYKKMLIGKKFVYTPIPLQDHA